MNGNPPLIVGSTFSGVGGIDRGLELAGMRIAWHAESDTWCRQILAHHWPDAYQYADVRHIGLEVHGGLRRPDADGGHDADARGEPDERPHPVPRPIDLLCGGFPCQDLSVAGKRAGLAGARSGLFHEFARIASALRPRWLLVENVPGLLSSNDGRDFGVVLHTLADIGYGVAWRVLDSRYFGVPQRRRRVFIVGRLGGDHRAALRALCESCPGSPQASPCTWQSTPGGTRGGPRGNGGVRDVNMAPTLKTPRGGGGLSPESPFAISTLQGAPGRGYRIDAESAAGGHLVQLDGRVGLSEERSYGLQQHDARIDRIAVGELDGLRKSHTQSIEPGSSIGGRGVHDGTPSVVSHHANSRPGEVKPREGVRRLTPRECERLQGFPDDWTLVPGLKCPDSRRYAAMGNAVTVNVAEWIGRRIVAIDADTPETFLEAADLARGA